MISQPIPFLANIILVAHADEKLTANELGQLEAIRNELKLKKGDLSSAQSAVKAGTHQLTLVGTFADQVKNLELIFRVALADNDLDHREAEIIQSFAASIGLTSEQIDKLYAQALAFYEATDLLCPKCGATNDKSAKYCSGCGAGLRETSSAEPDESVVPDQGFCIQFSDSTAAAFPRALKLARSHPTFTSFQSGSKTWFSFAFSRDALLETLSIVDALSAMRNRRVFVDGAEQDWNSIFGFAWCATKRTGSYRPDTYCFGGDERQFNPWGCVRAHMDWSDWAEWMTYGTWERKGLLSTKHVWRFDKARIRHELEARLYKYRFCPHLDQRLLAAVIAQLPDTVDPETDRNWGYHEVYEALPGSIKVTLKDTTGGMLFSQELWANGVKPQGFLALKHILLKAFHETGADGRSVQSLLK